MNQSTTLSYQNMQLAPFPMSTTVDKLIILDKNQQMVDFPLEKESITIGRARDNDIVLSDYAVSRYHVRLERRNDCWIASDIGSTNGIVVNAQLVKAGNSAIWDNGSTLKLGPYALRWQRGADDDAQFPELTYVQQPVAYLDLDDDMPSEHSSMLALDEPPEIGIRNQQASVYDDQPSTLSIAVHNRRGVSDTYQVELVGLPPEWVATHTQIISLDSYEQGIVSFVVRPTTFETMSSSEFQFRVQASSISNPMLSAETADSLTVMPRHQFMTQIKESGRKFGQLAELSIQNIGTAPDFFEVDAQSANDNVSFETRYWNMALSPHTMDKISIAVRVKQRPWFRAPAPIPYTIEVRSNSGLTRRHNSTVSVRPKISGMAIVLFLMSLIVLAAALWSIIQFI